MKADSQNIYKAILLQDICHHVMNTNRLSKGLDLCTLFVYIHPLSYARWRLSDTAGSTCPSKRGQLGRGILTWTASSRSGSATTIVRCGSWIMLADDHFFLILYSRSVPSSALVTDNAPQCGIQRWALRPKGPCLIICSSSSIVKVAVLSFAITSLRQVLTTHLVSH